MNIKKESRLLLLSELDNNIVVAVVRGYAGIEGTALYNDCDDLREALKSGRGLLAEVNYVISNYNICGELGLRTISLNEIEDEDLLKAIKEVANMLLKVKLRYALLKTTLFSK